MNKLIPQVAEISIVYKPRMNSKDRLKITSSQDAFEILKNNWPDDIHHTERIIVLLLNRNNQVLGKYSHSSGGISGTVCDIKKILSVALKSLSSGIIVSHNHPSGNLSPSNADRELTRRIKDACKTMDISFLDHIIISPENGYYSFADESLI